MPPAAEDLHVVHINLERNWRGGERQVALLTRALANLKVRQSVLVRADGDLHRKLLASDLPADVFPVRGRADALRQILMNRFQRAVFHAHTGHAIPLALAGRWRHGGVAIVHRRVAFAPRSSLLLRADQVIALSDAVAAQCASSGVPSDRIAVIPPIHEAGLSLPGRIEARRRLRIREDVVMGLTVAALAPEKNPQLVLDMMRRLENVEHYWIGGGSAPPGARREAHLHFPGFQHDVGIWLAAADYFLLPSFSEGFGSSVLDAIAAGLPLILSDIPGLRAWVPSDAAWWFDPQQPQQAADAVRACLGDPERAAERVTRAKKALAECAAEKVANRTLSVYAKALKQAR